MLQAGRITPHLFQPVKFPAFRMHHMHHHIHIIDQHPLGGMGTFMMKRLFFTFLQYLVLDIICNSPDLRLTARFADDKKISHCFIDFPEIKGHDMLPFLLLNRCNNGFDDF